MDTKTCTKCNETKELKLFNAQKNGKYGVTSVCKVCRSEYDKNPKHKQRRLEYSRKRGYTDADRDYYAKRRVEEPEWYLHQSAKNGAKKRGIHFSITIDDILIPDVCPIFGWKLEMKATGSKHKPNDFSPSVDRIDSAKGYVKGNVAIISYRANIIKNSGTIEEHRRIADWMEEQDNADSGKLVGQFQV